MRRLNGWRNTMNADASTQVHRMVQLNNYHLVMLYDLYENTMRTRGKDLSDFERGFITGGLMGAASVTKTGYCFKRNISAAQYSVSALNVHMQDSPTAGSAVGSKARSCKHFLLLDTENL